MKVTYYGHSCFGLESSGIHVLFDPFISGNELASQVDLASIPADYILASHGHADHIGDLVTIGSRTGATVVGVWEIHEWASRHGLKTHPMNTGGSWTFDFGTLRLVGAIHSSSFPDGTYAGNPVGLVLQLNEGKTIYYAGDTALHMDMQLIAKRNAIDLAFLPIGGNFTMDVQDAVIAAEFIQCNRIIGMHYDTFGYIKIDHSAAQDLFRKAGRELILMDIGSSYTL
jgi:L-ascorbate metabolism protein UlaG (beta-lactamase superfamily)